MGVAVAPERRGVKCGWARGHRPAMESGPWIPVFAGMTGATSCFHGKAMLGRLLPVVAVLALVRCELENFAFGLDGGGYDHLGLLHFLHVHGPTHAHAHLEGSH